MKRRKGQLSSMGAARAVGVAWDELEPPVLGFVRKVVLVVAAALAAPFLALALVFFLLDWHVLWVVVPASMGALLLGMGLILWLVVRAKLREVRARIEQAERVERRLWGEP